MRRLPGEVYTKPGLNAFRSFKLPRLKIMYYVYLLRSISDPTHTYVGYTLNLHDRLNAHNSGNGLHTCSLKPWELIMYLGFKQKIKAIEFERYLKSSSGRAFASKRLW